jgi:hypothetical protein
MVSWPVFRLSPLSHPEPGSFTLSHSIRILKGYIKRCVTRENGVLRLLATRHICPDAQTSRQGSARGHVTSVHPKLVERSTFAERRRVWSLGVSDVVSGW